MDYSNQDSYDFSKQSNYEMGSNNEIGSDSQCGSSVEQFVNSDNANSPYQISPLASSDIFSSSSLAAYAAASYAQYMSSDRANYADRFGCIEEEESEDEFIIVDDDVTGTSIANEVVQHQPEIQPEPEPMNVDPDGLVRDLAGVDISGHQVSRVIVSFLLKNKTFFFNSSFFLVTVYYTHGILSVLKCI